MRRLATRLLIPIALFSLLAACLERPTEDSDARVPDAHVNDDAAPRDATPGPDASTTCSADDLVDQHQCGSGQKCTLIDPANHVGCAPAGMAAAYGGCEHERPDNCVIGTLCIDAKDPGEYLCLPFCYPPDTFCQGGICSYQVALQGGDEAFLCEPADFCEPVGAPTPGECGQNEACYLVRIGGDLTFCEIEGGVGLGETCQGDFSCTAGMTCFGPPEQPGTCRELCHVGTDCANGPCGPITETYGICP